MAGSSPGSSPAMTTPLELITARGWKCASLLHLLEISQVGRRLIAARRHELAVAALVVGFVADLHEPVVADAVVFEPVGELARIARVGLLHLPWTRIGVVGQGV